MRLIDTFFNARVFAETLPLLLRGLWVTIELGVASIVLGLILGFIFCLGGLNVLGSFMNERFISLVEPATLRIIDSGICLGHPPRDDLITLESLPSVIREAIDDDLLVILRHP